VKQKKLIVIAALVIGVAAGNAATLQEPVDTAINAKIRDEALNRSQVYAMFTHLVDTIGPRLTASPEHKRAAEWARDLAAKWGLSNPRVEPFEFGRGWALDKFTLEMVEPRYMPLVGYPEAWSPSTSGEIVAPAVFLAGKSAEDAEAMQAQFKGAAILQAAMVNNFIRTDRMQPTDSPDDPPPGAGRQGGRGAQPGQTGRGGQPGQGGRGGRGAQPGDTPSPAQRIDTAIRAGGAAVLLRPSRGEHGTLFVQAGRGENANDRLPKIVLIGEHYNLIARLTAQGIPVKLRVNVQSRFLDDRNSYNMLAEIPGTDPALREEVVMLGAHLDSWHTATGATDNADGSAAALEAFRILKAVGAQPRRTLRLALWGGEEQGLLGSRAYVNKYLAGDQNADARKKLMVYFNIDPGKGPIYGWYLENNEAVKPIFDAWLAPFRDLDPPARRNVAGPIGSTDHVAFNNAGILGFNPVQDFVNYDVREHHTNVDTSERVLERDLKQNAVILASFLYHAANRREPLPVRRPPAGQ
jgi:hypothetical protein